MQSRITVQRSDRTDHAKKKNQSISEPGIDSPKTRHKERQNENKHLPNQRKKYINMTGKHSLVRSDPLVPLPLTAAHTHTVIYTHWRTGICAAVTVVIYDCSDVMWTTGLQPALLICSKNCSHLAEARVANQPHA